MKRKLRKPLTLLLAVALALGGVLVGNAEDGDTQPFGTPWPTIKSFTLTGDLEPYPTSLTLKTHKDRVEVMHYDELQASTVSGNENCYLAGEIRIPVSYDSLTASAYGIKVPADVYTFEMNCENGKEGNCKAPTEITRIKNGLHDNTNRVFEIYYTGELLVYEEGGNKLYYLIKPVNEIYLRGMIDTTYWVGASGPLTNFKSGGNGLGTASVAYDYDSESKTFTMERYSYLPGRDTFAFSATRTWGNSLQAADHITSGMTVTLNMQTNNPNSFTVENMWGPSETFYFKLIAPWRLVALGKDGQYSFGEGSVKVGGYDETPDDTTGYVDTIYQGDTVEVTVTPEEPGQVIDTVTLTNETEGIGPVTATVKGNTFSFVMPNDVLTIADITFKEPNSANDILSVELLEDGAPLGDVSRDGNDITITLPSSTPQETANKVANGGGLYLKVEPSPGATVAQAGGYSDTAAGASLWPNGGVLCYMPLNTSVKFTVTAENGDTQDYTITIAYTPDDGGDDKTRYTVKTASNLSGGSLSANYTEAEEGTTVTVTVTPNTGKKLEAGSLCWTEATAGGETVAINETTLQFQMPAKNITISCRFTDAAVETSTSPSITSFVINGVSGTVNDTTGVITLTLPSGTSKKSLAPSIATKNTAAITPSSGTAVDFTSAVTYTLTGTDGSTRSYVVYVYTSSSSSSTTDDLWDEIYDPTDTEPWWEYAEDYQGRWGGTFPQYW